jgi:hypothetical protein
MEVEMGEYFEEEDIRQIREINLRLSEGKRFCVLLDTSKGYFNITPEANKLLASKEYAELRMATAIVARSLATRIAGNFFIRVNRPPTPTRLFSTEEDAVKWLKSLPLER